jgi:phosphoribosylformylglycinamidine synthase
MVYRVFVSKKSSSKDDLLKDELNSLLQSNIDGLKRYYGYSVEDIDEDLFNKSINRVFCEPNVDDYTFELPAFDEVISVELLDGQFDQRSDSASSCIALLGMRDKPTVKSSTVYALNGNISSQKLAEIKDYLINSVEASEASLEKRDSLKLQITEPKKVEVLKGFAALTKSDLVNVLDNYSLAMDIDDLLLFQSYFIDEKRDPTITELKVVDTYWSDHCRHTTFNTELKNIEILDEDIKDTFEKYLEIRKTLNVTKPITLMNLATIAVKDLKSKGYLATIEESEEINACSIKIKVNKDSGVEDYLLLFKNETHNHPTEIEPFGGAATCIGGAIRDPLSSRAYVYQAMRLSGCSDPREAFEDTMANKMPQRKLAITSSEGNSSYGNQIGLATGLVDEFYHPGYKAKHMELGAVIGAAPLENVVRETPLEGDVVILLGGRTGRDGIGGATGSSKSHDKTSLASCGAEVQKGNAPEERKLQRLFLKNKVTTRIKRCNDFGAGGVCVAIGELSPSLTIELDKVPLKYLGLDPTEIAISESQERMAVVVRAEDTDFMINEARIENLEATVVATITDCGTLKMNYKGDTVVSLSRAFLDTNGAKKENDVLVKKESELSEVNLSNSLEETLIDMYSSLDFCSRKGLASRFDSTIGASSVLMPFGGKYQTSSEQSMVAKIPLQSGETSTVSIMSYGFDPKLLEGSPFKGSYLSVLSSVSKIMATGASYDDVYLSLQEYFPSLKTDKEKWGIPFAALLGAFKAQEELKVGAIGGKDSMSGTFEDLSVPNTLVSFAVSTGDVESILPSVFMKYNSPLFVVPIGDDDQREYFKKIEKLTHSNTILSSYSLTRGKMAQAIVSMAMGNRIGAVIDPNVDLFEANIGSILFEVEDAVKFTSLADEMDLNIVEIGETTKDYNLCYGDEFIELKSIEDLSFKTLEDVYPLKSHELKMECETISYEAKNIIVAKNKIAKPKVLIPVFPGTNCEIDSIRAVERVGFESEYVIINTLDAKGLSESANRFSDKLGESQLLFIPGGFSAGDQPEGSAKFIASFLRSPRIRENLTRLIDDREGLVLGICNGFQALIKSGLLPYGKIRDLDDTSPTLTYNFINRHQSSLVRTRISSTLSPWLSLYEVGETLTVPISHGEGRFVCDDNCYNELKKNNQISLQYVDLNGKVTNSIEFNPNGSTGAIESICSKDGRILGKMGHTERCQKDLYQNYPLYESDDRLFKGALNYFK